MTRIARGLERRISRPEISSSAEANRLSKEGRWAEMADLIDDEMLETFAVCAAPEEVGDALAKRCDYATRVSPSMPYEADATKLAPFLSPLRV